MSGTGPNNDVLSWARVTKLISQAQKFPDQAAAMLRGGVYGELVADILTGKQQKLASEGSFYLTRTPTPGTGTASITAPTAYVATSPYIIVTNSNPPGGKDVFLDYINLNLVTPGTSSTDLQFTTALDAISRYSSGGIGGSGTGLSSILAGPNPTNSAAPHQSGALVYAGALVAVAAGPQNIIMCNRILRTAIAVAKDTYTIQFGSTDLALDGTLVSGAAIAQRSIPHPPVCVAPGGTFLFHLYGTAMAAATTCEIEVGHTER